MTYLTISSRRSVPKATREIRALRKAPRSLYSRQRGSSRSANSRSYSAACSARMWMTMTSSSLMTAAPLVALASILATGPPRVNPWFEEEEPLLAHAHDPHKRVDVVASSRAVRVEIDGVLLAESR